MSVPGLSVWFLGDLNLLRNVRVVLTPTLWHYQSSLLPTDTSSHGWRDEPSSVCFSLEVLVRKFF